MGILFHGFYVGHPRNTCRQTGTRCSIKEKSPYESILWIKFYDEGVPARVDYPTVPRDRFLSDSAMNHPAHEFRHTLFRPVILNSDNYPPLNSCRWSRKTIPARIHILRKNPQSPGVSGVQRVSYIPREFFNLFLYLPLCFNIPCHIANIKF